MLISLVIYRVGEEYRFSQKGREICDFSEKSLKSFIEEISIIPLLAANSQKHLPAYV